MISFTEAQLLAWVTPVLWPFLRMLALMQIMPVLGQRIQNIHLKEFTKKGTDFSLESFRPLLDGTTNWPALLEELDKINYRGFLTFEYFHPYPHFPEALVWQTSDSLDRILGRKV